MNNSMAPNLSAPPREVYEWTTVLGHEPRIRRRIRDRVLVGLCSCGERQVNASWRDEHLGNAWPILIPRMQGETDDDWRMRLNAALEDARAEDERRSEDLLGRMTVEPGDSYPLITDEDVAAGLSVQVLEHQLAGPPFRSFVGWPLGRREFEFGEASPPRF